MKKRMNNNNADSASPLTFEQWLSEQPDERLATILRNRPDCALPIPPSFSSLAARLRLPLAVKRAVDKLGAMDIAVVEAASARGAELQPVSTPEVVEEIRGRLHAYSTPYEDIPTQYDVEAALETLKDHALLYGTTTDGSSFQLLPEVMSEIPRHFLVLPESASAGPPLTHQQVEELLDALSPQESKILDTLAQAGGVGLSKDAAPDADPTRPVAMLIAKGLLTRVDHNTVRLRAITRNVLLNPSNTPHRYTLVPATRMPDTPPSDKDVQKVDQAATAAGLEVTRMMRRLLEELGREPAPCLKNGSLGVRAATKLAKTLDIDNLTLARLMCLADSADLISTGEPDPPPHNDNLGDYLAPTPLADDWLQSDPADQWASLLEAWRNSQWSPWLVGHKDDTNKTIHLLDHAALDTHLPAITALTMRPFLRLPPGTPVPPDNVSTDMRYLSPLRGSHIDPTRVADICSNAEWIGAIALNAASTPLRTMMGTSDTDAYEALRKVTQSLTPEPGTTLIAQADMTILAPGPLTKEIQEQVETLADVESPGLASVYRITEASIRRALDTGRTGADLQQFLEENVLGDVPQSITYLITDVARRHGTLRGGPAISYLRSDDPALLAQAVQTPAAARLALRLIAPTVAISQAPLIEVLDNLREAGFQPVAEDATGASIDVRPSPSRITSYQGRPAATREAIDAGLIHAVVSELRRNNTATTAASQGTTATNDQGQVLQGREALSVLQAAVRGRKTVTLGFVDKQGTQMHRVVRPLTVSGGQVDALDAATGKVHRFQLHRITEVILD